MKEITLLVNQKKGNDEKRFRDKPFRTLSAAIQKAKEILRNREFIELNIALSDARYEIDAPISFTAADFRTTASTLTFYGAQGRPVITSNREIAGCLFEKVDGKPYYMYEFPESAKNKKGLFPDFRDFYCNGRRVPLARTPIDTHIPFAIPCESDRESEKNQVPKLYVSKPLLDGIELDTVPSTELWIQTGALLHCLHITSVERRDHREGYVAVRLAPEEYNRFIRSYPGTLAGCPAFLQNNLLFLTEPNHFYYDRKNGRIYYYPENDYMVERAVFAYPMCERLFDFSRVSNIAFENLAFTGTASNDVTENGYITGRSGSVQGEAVGFASHAAIYGENCKNIRIEGCDFYDLASDAASFDFKTRNLTVTASSFRRIGASAIRVGGTASKWDTEKNSSKNIILENNLIEDAGVTYTGNAALFIGKAERVQICHNTIKRSYGSAISAGFFPCDAFPNLNHLDISYNYIDGFMLGAHEGAAIYTVGTNAPRKNQSFLNFLHHNYIAVPSGYEHTAVGYHVICHDLGSSHWRDTDNVILAREEIPPRDAFVIAGAHNNLLERTYILNYSLPYPRTVKALEGEGGAELRIEERETNRSLTTDHIPDEVARIISASGSNTSPAKLPTRHVYAHTATIQVSEKDGNDRHSGLSSAPCKTLRRAIETLSDILSSKSDIKVRIEIAPGEYTVDETIYLDIRDYISENFAVSFVGTGPDTIISGAARTLFLLSDIKNLRFRGLSFQGRNASVGSSIFRIRNGAEISFIDCNFSRINANAILFSGLTEKITVKDSVFSHIGGSALRFGVGTPHSELSGNSGITIQNNLFEYIGYVIAESPAIYCDVLQNGFIRQNTFLSLSYEAISLGCGSGPALYPFGYDYNIANTSISGNYIDEFSMLRGGSAIRLIGGNCTPFHRAPMNYIYENYIKVGEKTGNATSEFSIISHEKAASQLLTKDNCILPAKHNKSSIPLLYLSTDPHAYSIWLEGNMLLSEDPELLFIEPLAIREKKYELHDHNNRKSAAELTDEAKHVILSAGCDISRPNLPK